MNCTAGRSSGRLILLMVLVAGSFCGGFVFGGPPWKQSSKILASDGDDEHGFGGSIALSGNTAVIGASGSSLTGAAYIIDILTGQQIHKLVPSDGKTGEYFGTSVAVDGNIALIGAPYHGIDSGKVYVYDIITGQEIDTLLPNDIHDGMLFGISVAIKGNLAIVGADRDTKDHTAAAYAFDLTNGQQLFKMTATGGSSSDRFGQSVATNGKFILVGAPQDNNESGTDAGAAYLFDAVTGQQLKKYVDSSTFGSANLGFAVTMDNDYALLGSLRSDNNRDGNFSGAVLVYDLASGSQLYKLFPLDRRRFIAFSHSIAINNGLALIGAFQGKGNQQYSGSAYLFDLSTGNELFKYIASDGEEDDFFGTSVAFNNNLALIGASADDDNGYHAGATYLFQPVNINDTLRVNPQPLIAGQRATFTLHQGLPNETSWLIYSTDGLEQSYIRALNAIVDISNPRIAIGHGLTDANGNRRITRRMPHVLQPMNIWFQAVQRENTTNVVATEILP